MSGVFRNIDPPPPHRPASVYPPAFGVEGGHTRRVERGWGVKTPDTVLYSIYVCTLWVRASDSYCTHCNCHELNPSILRHIEIWGAAVEAVLMKVHQIFGQIAVNKFVFDWLCNKERLQLSENSGKGRNMTRHRYKQPTHTGFSPSVLSENWKYIEAKDAQR